MTVRYFQNEKKTIKKGGNRFWFLNEFCLMLKFETSRMKGKWGKWNFEIAYSRQKLANFDVKKFLFSILIKRQKAKFNRLGWDYGTRMINFPKILMLQFGPFYRALLLTFSFFWYANKKTMFNKIKLILGLKYWLWIF